MVITLEREKILFAGLGATKGNSEGFTLLELLVALAIAAIILMGVYRMVDGTANSQRFLEKRQEQLHLWIYLRRLLQRDLDQRQELLGHAFSFGSDASQTSVALHCFGGVVPGRMLGPVVDVRYVWEENPDGEGVTWVRELRGSVDEKMEPGLNMRITEGLEAVTFAVLDKNEWKNLGEEMEPPLRAVRWQFRWSIIGPWTLVQRLEF